MKEVFINNPNNPEKKYSDREIYFSTMNEISSWRHGSKIGSEYPFSMIERIEEGEGADNLKINKICSSLESLINNAEMMKKSILEAKEEHQGKLDKEVVGIVFKQALSENNSLEVLMILDLLSKMYRESGESLNIEEVNTALDNLAETAKNIKVKFEEKL